MSQIRSLIILYYTIPYALYFPQCQHQLRPSTPAPTIARQCVRGGTLGVEDNNGDGSMTIAIMITMISFAINSM